MRSSLLWFRNDLRTHDNPAFNYFNLQPERGKRKALFFVSKKQWQQHHWSAIKIDLIIRHANAVASELERFNIDLEIVHVDYFNDQVEFLHHYCQTHRVTELIANSEVELNEQKRDAKCREIGLPLTLFESDVIVPKGKVLNQSGQMFKIFTPFKRVWLKYVKCYGFDYLGKPDPQQGVDAKCKGASKMVNDVHGQSAAWPLASFVEQETIPRFFQERLLTYSENRDIPSIKGTSGLSPYLAAGLISPRYLLRLLLSSFPDLLTSTDKPEFTWLNELIWREFYRHLLDAQPRLCKHQNFNSKYDQVTWPNSPDLFDAWCQGKTGYPIVDAAMRQLNQTGWMHNRLRMVTASFLTKHLLVDWRKGEQYFMQHLIDGDLSANNGGWQWAASTGCDAQPYFRVFNPIRQSERFDPNGDFIRKYIPELADVPSKDIHFPHKYLEKNSQTLSTTYWPAIVEHKQARARAIAFYK